MARQGGQGARPPESERSERGLTTDALELPLRGALEASAGLERTSPPISSCEATAAGLEPADLDSRHAAAWVLDWALW